MERELKARALSRNTGEPVLKAPSPRCLKQVNDPGSSSSVWLCEDPAIVLKSPLSFYVDGCDSQQVKEARLTEEESSVLIQREKEVYRHLGSHPHVLQCLKINSMGLTFPYIHDGNLRGFLQHHPKTPLAQRLDWIRSALGALTFVHSKEVLHCDISTRNFLVADDLALLLCDFSGSKIGELQGMVRAETRYEKQYASSTDTSIDSEIFAMGSLLYEILFGSPPYQDVDDDEVEALFKKNSFPCTTHLFLGDIVHDCWVGTFTRSDQIQRAVHAAGTSLPSVPAPKVCLEVV